MIRKSKCFQIRIHRGVAIVAGKRKTVQKLRDDLSTRALYGKKQRTRKTFLRAVHLYSPPTCFEYCRLTNRSIDGRCEPATGRGGNKKWEIILQDSKPRKKNGMRRLFWHCLKATWVPESIPNAVACWKVGRSSRSGSCWQLLPSTYQSANVVSQPPLLIPNPRSISTLAV